MKSIEHQSLEQKQIEQTKTEPIRAVWCMAIQKAFEDATTPRKFKCRSKQEASEINRAGAAAWINGKDFEMVCDALGISYEIIRDQLNKKLKEQLCQN